MSESTSSAQASPGGSGGMGRSAPPAIVSPVEPVERSLALHKPVTRGFAVVLVLLNFAVMGWMFARQNDTLDRIESSIESVGAGVDALPVTTAAPETCWLVGALARADGKAAQLSAALSGTGSAWSTCLMYTQRGALGQDLDGN